MSYNNKNLADNKVYDLLNPPPSHDMGGKPDHEGNDTYWGRSLTIQADEANANIQKIMKGEGQPSLRNNPLYGDFTQVKSYQESLNLVMVAQAQFSLLDAKIRAKFQNDPSKFLEFVHDNKNEEELIKLGLANPKPPKELPKAPPAKEPENSK